MITVGPKAVLELKAYLSENDLFAECSFCKNLIVNGKVLHPIFTLVFLKLVDCSMLQS